MRFSTLSGYAALLSSHIVFASPLPIAGNITDRAQTEFNDRKLVDRDGGPWIQVYFCEDPDFTGYCAFGYSQSNYCNGWGWDPQDNNFWTSIGPDQNSGTCYLFHDTECKSESLQISYPGMGQLPPGWDNNVNGWGCIF